MSLHDEARNSRENSAGWKVQRLAGRMNRAMSERLEAFGLTQQQFAILVMVIEVDGITQKGLGERFAMPPYAITRALDVLERKGLIERREDPASRRAHNIHATAAGREMAPSLFAMVRELNDLFLSPLSAEEAAKLHELLKRLLEGSD